MKYVSGDTHPDFSTISSTTEAYESSGNEGIKQHLNMIPNFVAADTHRNRLLTPSSVSSNISPGLVTASSHTCAQSVSILDRRYLLVEPPTGNRSHPVFMTQVSRNPVVKVYNRCIKLDTKEEFICKVVRSNEEGRNMLAAYHRLAEGCNEISKIHEIILSSRCFYLIMPATFGNVNSYLLAKKRIEEPEAANILRQMILAVQFCHNKGIVLRDIKMGKFVFHDRERTRVKLDTLEDAVLLADLNDDNLNDKHGCPNYVSPEKADSLGNANKKYPGKATDIWGLGVMLYAMLVGRFPYEDDNHSRLFIKVRNASVIFPDSGVSPQARFLTRCLLHKNPSKRPSCGELLNHSWLTQSERSVPYANARSSIAFPQNTFGSISESGLPTEQATWQQESDQIVPTRIS